MLFNVSGRISGKYINCIKWIKDFFSDFLLMKKRKLEYGQKIFGHRFFWYICAYLISGIRQNYWPAGYPAESVSGSRIHLMRFINIQLLFCFICLSVFTKEWILSALVSCSSRRTKYYLERRSRTLIWLISARKRLGKNC